MSTIRPNCGPYVVSYLFAGKKINKECHSWASACYYMRQLLIEGYEPTVKFT